ncbi:hypothetical protein HMPREF9061_00935 [Actinomyces sp. oral taxon 181 str. F0379]|nr:hypothetical protein HMPREF9061_00935 [Actinomyces sp. oral taxon 181 str. F0379]
MHFPARDVLGEKDCKKGTELCKSYSRPLHRIIVVSQETSDARSHAENRIITGDNEMLQKC